MTTTRSTRISRRSTRRTFLGTTAAAAISAAFEASQPPVFAAPSVGSRAKVRARLRPDLVDEKSPKGIEVVQLTAETEVPSSHL